jgi:hypothetical protein
MLHTMKSLVQHPGDTLTLIIARGAESDMHVTVLRKVEGIAPEKLPAFTLRGTLEEITATLETGVPELASAQTSLIEQMRAATTAQQAINTSSKSGKPSSAPKTSSGTPSKASSGVIVEPQPNPRIAELETSITKYRNTLDSIARGNGLSSAFEGEGVIASLCGMPVAKQYATALEEVRRLQPGWTFTAPTNSTAPIAGLFDAPGAPQNSPSNATNTSEMATEGDSSDAEHKEDNEDEDEEEPEPTAD